MIKDIFFTTNLKIMEQPSSNLVYKKPVSAIDFLWPFLIQSILYFKGPRKLL